MQSLIIRIELTARLISVLTYHSLASLAVLFLWLNVTDTLPTEPLREPVDPVAS